MKRISILIFTFLLIISCSNQNTSRNIKINELEIKSTSIRAIQVIDAKTMYYVGSKGDFGYTYNGGQSWSVKYITFQDSIIPHFRSLVLLYCIKYPKLKLNWDIKRQQIKLN
jgi:hypothetical protein